VAMLSHFQTAHSLPPGLLVLTDSRSSDSGKTSFTTTFWMPRSPASTLTVRVYTTEPYRQVVSPVYPLGYGDTSGTKSAGLAPAQHLELVSVVR